MSTHKLQSARSPSKSVTETLGRNYPRYCLAGIQRAMVLRSAIAPHLGSYVQQLEFTALGPYRSDDWHAAWKEVVARHEVLRSRVEWDRSGEPQLYFDPSKSVPMVSVRVEDAGAASPERIESAEGDFRVVGGDSISAMKLLLAVEKRQDNGFRCQHSYKFQHCRVSMTRSKQRELPS